MNTESKELYINMKPGDIPAYPKSADEPISKELFDFISEEQRKCREGVNINGFHLWGTYYYHINHHAITQDLPNGTKIIGTPKFRDNDFLVHESYNQCLIERKGFIIGSRRQVAKSDNMVSLTLHQLSLYENSVAMGVFLGIEDIETFTRKIDVACKHGTDFIVKQRPNNSWVGNEHIFGIKYKQGTVSKFSTLVLRNSNHGKSPQVAAGVSATFVFMDEVGKGDSQATYTNMLPTIEGAYGLTCSPILAFTSADVVKIKDAKNMFLHPEAFQLKNFGTDNFKHGFFMDGRYKMEYKKERKFSDWYFEEKGIKLNVPELDGLPFLAADKKLAEQKILKLYEDAKEAGVEKFNQERMINPLVISDMFLGGTNNIFDHLRLEIERVLLYLESDARENKPRHLEFEYLSRDLVQAKFSEKHLLTDYPRKRNTSAEDNNTAVAVVDEPRLKVRGKAYVFGSDLINVDKTTESNSLVSCYAMRRQSSNYNDKFEDSIVAWYNGRTDIMGMRRTLVSMLEYYGASEGKATMLHEAANDDFTRYMSEHYKDHYLEDTYDIGAAIIENKGRGGKKGMYPLKKIQVYYLGLILEYLEEDLGDGKKGVWRIPDPYLLRQFLSFDGDLGPCDAIVAFGHCLMHLHKEKRFRLVDTASGVIEEEKREQVVKQRIKTSLSTHTQPFNKESKIPIVKRRMI